MSPYRTKAIPGLDSRFVCRDIKPAKAKDYGPLEDVLNDRFRGYTWHVKETSLGDVAIKAQDRDGRWSIAIITKKSVAFSVDTIELLAEAAREAIEGVELQYCKEAFP